MVVECSWRSEWKSEHRWIIRFQTPSTIFMENICFEIIRFGQNVQNTLMIVNFEDKHTVKLGDFLSFASP